MPGAQTEVESVEGGVHTVRRPCKIEVRYREWYTHTHTHTHTHNVPCNVLREIEVRYREWYTHTHCPMQCPTQNRGTYKNAMSHAE